MNLNQLAVHVTNIFYPLQKMGRADSIAIDFPVRKIQYKIAHNVHTRGRKTKFKEFNYVRQPALKQITENTTMYRQIWVWPVKHFVGVKYIWHVVKSFSTSILRVLRRMCVIRMMKKKKKKRIIFGYIRI